MRGISQHKKLEVVIRDASTCQYCGKVLADSSEVKIDHVIPYSRGGNSSLANLATSCNDCNTKKSAFVWVPKNINVLAMLNPEHAELIRANARIDAGKGTEADLELVLGKGNKGGRKPNPDGKARKAYQVYCTSEQVEYLRWWLKHKGEVPPAEKWKGKA